MKTIFICLCLIANLSYLSGNLLALNSNLLDWIQKVQDQPGPYDCALCTIFTLLGENYAMSHNISVDDFIENKMCTFFKTPLNAFCQTFVKNYGTKIIDSLANNSSPDIACRKAGLCIYDQCYLDPNRKLDLSFSSSIPRLRIAQEDLNNLKWDPAQELFKHPDVDFDNDTYAQFVAETRGYHWKGKDCNDFDASVYPGRRSNTSADPSKDNNCNGIYGINETTGVSYEETLCSGTSQYGFAVIGDSVGAHFELPWQWFNATVWNSTTWDDFWPRGLDEFDLPYLSGWTAFVNSTIGLPSDSLYKYFVDNNLCMHRDFQNAGVNGGESFSVQKYIREAFRRNPQTDYPLLAVLELVGNDVCGGPGQFTTTEQFQENILNIMNYFDSVTPPGSHLLVVGVANGSILYDTLASRTHPLGMNYSDFYDYLMCLDISPCPGWMTSNATARQLTTDQAMALNQVYRNLLVSNPTFQNFDWDFHDFPIQEVLDEWESQGGQAWELFEPVDGFHPNQIFHSMMADYFWNFLQANHSDWIGPENPNNLVIANLFGNQGGYL